MLSNFFIFGIKGIFDNILLIQYFHQNGKFDTKLEVEYGPGLRVYSRKRKTVASWKTDETSCNIHVLQTKRNKLIQITS